LRAADDPRVARRLLRAGLHVLAVGLLVGLTGMTVQAHAERSSKEANPPPGHLIDIGSGQRIHLRTWGAANERPTIVLDVSAAQPSSIWAWIARDLSTEYRVVAYDRPGMAWSAGAQGRDARSAADALSAALAAAGIGPPYVVVGHSFGGLSARVFAADHRADVRALVLLDTTYPEPGGGAAFAPLYRSAAWHGHTGLVQLFPPANWYSSLPPEESAGAFAVTQWTSHLDATAEELEAWDATVGQVQAAGGFGGLPLLVASVPGPPEHLELQRALLSLSTNSQLVILDTSHMAMLMEEAAARETASEIRAFLSQP
jgi:pimeloyl-ACP methyl ester carboxylesterase